MSITQPRRGVFIVAAQPLQRLGIAAALDQSFVVAGETGTAHEACEALRSIPSRLLILVLEPSLPDASPAEACVRLLPRRAGTASLVLLPASDAPTVELASIVPLAYRHGALGIYDTSIGPERIRNALTRIASGILAVQSCFLPYLLVERYGGDDVNAVAMTPTARELRALQSLADGWARDQIAIKLGTTPDAVDKLIERAEQRLGAVHRAHATAILMRRRLIS